MTFIKAKYLLPALLVLPVCVQAGPPVVEAADGNVNQRLQRLERLMDNQGLLDLYSQIQQLQDQVQKLSGQLEVQRHKLDLLEQSQQALLESSREPATVTDSTFADGRFDTGISEGTVDGLDVDTAGMQTNGSSVATLPDSADPDTAAVNRQIDNARVDEVITSLGGQGDPELEQQTYETAFNLLKQARYADAATAFQNFRRDYPDSSLSANAQYWLGEAYYVQRDFERAIVAYEEIPEKFTGNAKVPDALLKIGFSYHELGDVNSARTTLQNLRQNYPDSTAARLAEDRLQRLQSADG